MVKKVGGQDGTDYIEMDVKDINKYSKQITNYSYNFMMSSFKKYTNVRTYAVVNYKCYNTKEDLDYETRTYTFAKNLGRVDINIKTFN